MADNKRWFKVWTDLIGDFFLEEMPLEDVGRFALLGCLIAKKGDNGSYTVSGDVLRKIMGLENGEDNMHRLNPFLEHFNVEIKDLGNDTYDVSFKNWRKFQVDSTGYERLKKHRDRKSETANVTVACNANDNGVKNKTKTKKKTKIKKKEEKKNTYGLYAHVKLSDEQYKKLVEKFGQQLADAWIQNMDNAMEANTGKYKYTNYYQALLNWASRRPYPDGYENSDGVDEATLARMRDKFKNGGGK